jgi:hypothetical protein
MASDPNSDHSLIVITAASCEKGTLALYREQLLNAGIPFHVEDISSQHIPPLGGNSGIKTQSMIDLSTRFSDYQKIIFTDAFDMLFFGDKQSVLAKIPSDRVLWGAEKNCYPDQSIASLVPDRGPARFANGGLLAGTPAAMIDWATRLRERPSYHPNVLDQQYLNLYLAENNDLMCTIDHTSSLFFCLFGGYPELEFERGLPVNRMYDTHPNFCHANGHWSADEMWRKYEASL